VCLCVLVCVCVFMCLCVCVCLCVLVCVCLCLCVCVVYVSVSVVGGCSDTMMTPCSASKVGDQRLRRGDRGRACCQDARGFRLESGVHRDYEGSGVCRCSWLLLWAAEPQPLRYDIGSAGYNGTLPSGAAPPRSLICSIRRWPLVCLPQRSPVRHWRVRGCHARIQGS
jgi:hypothetical protein